MTKVMLGWHICRGDVLPHGDGRRLKIGATYKAEGPIRLCKNGLHASPTLREALRYVNTVDHEGAPDAWVSFVEVWGNIDNSPSCGVRKFCGRFRRHIAVSRITHAEQDAILNSVDGAAETAEIEVMQRVLGAVVTSPRKPVEDRIERFTEGRTRLSLDVDRRVAARLRKRNSQKKAKQLRGGKKKAKAA